MNGNLLKVAPKMIDVCGKQVLRPKIILLSESLWLAFHKPTWYFVAEADRCRPGIARASGRTDASLLFGSMLVAIQKV